MYLMPMQSVICVVSCGTWVATQLAAAIDLPVVGITSRAIGKTRYAQIVRATIGLGMSAARCGGCIGGLSGSGLCAPSRASIIISPSRSAANAIWPTPWIAFVMTMSRSSLLAMAGRKLVQRINALVKEMTRMSG